MNSEKIINSDVLDILFENRNKMYGAYNLRKFYNNRLCKALGGMLALVGIFAVFAFMSPKKKVLEIDKTGPIITTVTGVIKETKPTKEAKPQQRVRAAQAKHLSTIKIVKENPDTIGTITKFTPIGSYNVAPEPGVPEPCIGCEPGPATVPGDPGPQPEPKPKPEPPLDPEEPMDNPDVEPEFPGGREGLRKFLERNLTNPKDMEEGEKVRVVVKFVVGYDGKLKAFETLQDGGEEFNREVMRVLKRMPAWIPGKAKGQNVSVFYTQSIVFTPAG